MRFFVFFFHVSPCVPVYGRVLSPKSWFFSIGTTDRIYCRSEQRRNCFLGPKDPPIYGWPFNVCQRNRTLSENTIVHGICMPVYMYANRFQGKSKKKN